MKIDVMVASVGHLKYVKVINDTIDEAAKARGTGIARRTDEYIADKINQGKAIIALNREEFVGFCYIESWGHEKFVANSGLIVKPSYRGMGVAKRIKKAAFDLSRKKFPHAKLFGLTTGEQVMRINTELGYVPVTFAKLTDDEQFWAGCKSCVNYDILLRTNMTKCLCTGMVYDPEVAAKREADKKLEEKKPVIYAGDLNVAHQEIDLKNPKTNRGNAGFTDEERACFSKVLENGFIDTFRYFYPEQTGIYSWWSYRFQARAKNAGWRIDYFVVSQCLQDRLADAKIHTEVPGSDHCPIELDLQ